MRRLTVLLLALAMLAGLTACGMEPADPDTAQESIQVIAMDTVMTFSVYGAKSTHAVYAAEDEVRRLEGLLSRTDPESDVSRLNAAPAGEAVTVSEDTRSLLEMARFYAMMTEGAFDCTLAPVSSAWGFTEDSFRVPSRAELDGLLEHVGWEKFQLSEEQNLTVSHDEGVEIDLGGIAKGYVTDVIAGILEENNVPRATISLGGNVLVWGDRPDGTPWRVGIQDPARADAADGYAGFLSLTDAFAVTSGSYQRYFEEGGKRYHHIIDPATGCPADSGLTSVTVVEKREKDANGNVLGSGTECDALSTALFVMGEEKALEFWRTERESRQMSFDLVLVTEDGRVVVTEGIADVFTPDETSGYAYETVS